MTTINVGTTRQKDDLFRLDTIPPKFILSILDHSIFHTKYNPMPKRKRKQPAQRHDSELIKYGNITKSSSTSRSVEGYKGVSKYYQNKFAAHVM